MNPDISPTIETLLRVYEDAENKKPSDEKEPKLKVNQVISKVAFLYEKVRTSVEYIEGEHLMRKNAVERAIKRRVDVAKDPDDVARPLLEELVRSGYIENDTVPETKIGEVQKVLRKYVALNKALDPKAEEMHSQLAAYAACEIEALVTENKKELALVEAMYRTIKDDVKIPEVVMSQKERNIQIYIAIYRSLMKADNAMVGYRLLRLYIPNWDKITPEDAAAQAKNFPEILRKLEDHIRHPLGERLERLMKKYTVLFVILRDAIEEDPDGARALLNNPEKLDEAITKFTKIRYGAMRKKLRRSAFRSIIYILLTKMLIAVLIEVPVDSFIAGHIVLLPLFINILFHPALLFMIALSTQIPNKKNTEAIKDSVRTIVTGKGGFILPPVRSAFVRRPVLNWLYRIMYFLTFASTFGAMIYVLDAVDFTWASIIIFLLFLTVVSYFGVRIREASRELRVIERRENIITFLFDFFTLPIIRAGRWISIRFSKLNVFVFVLDFIIEAPLQFLIEIVEDWTSYMKERKEEVY